MSEFKKSINNIFMAKEYKNIINKFVKWVTLGGISGVIVGCFIALFLNSLVLGTKLREENQWLLYLLPLGGAFVSYLYVKIGKNSIKGNNLVIEAINDGEENIPLRMAPLVLFGTFITHLFGGSAGREGTGVQIGASISGFIGRVFKLNNIDYRILIVSGVSSGFSAVFGTPISGTIFGLEVAAIGVMKHEALIPCVVASFTANFTTMLFNVSHSHYNMGERMTPSYSLFIKIVLCALAFGLMSRVFSSLTYYLKKLLSKLFHSSSVKSFIGGIIIILLTFIVGNRIYLGLSLDLLSNSFTYEIPNSAFLWKTIFTSLTLSAGFQGGEVTPLFVIGATLGNFIATFINLPISFIAGLGMIGVFCGCTNTPVASFIMGIELFGVNNLEYVFIVCIISYFFSGNGGIYSSQKAFRPTIMFKDEIEEKQIV